MTHIMRFGRSVIDDGLGTVDDSTFYVVVGFDECVSTSLFIHYGRMTLFPLQLKITDIDYEL
jgi:hypothetical protein